MPRGAHGSNRVEARRPRYIETVSRRGYRLVAPVKPAEVPHEEYLRYTIQPAASNAAAVTLAWEKRAVTFRIEVFPQAN